MATQETIKQLNVGGVLRDVEDVTARGLISSLQTALNALTSGDTTTAIESFNEIVAFLENVSDSSTLQGIIAGLNTSIATKYTKPSTGIPATDLAQAVRDLLGKAATALQSHQDISGKADKSEMSVTPGTGANADKTTIQLKSGTSATVLTQHQDISGKQDKLTEGANITISQDGTISANGVGVARLVQVASSVESEGDNIFKLLYTDGTESDTFIIKNGKQGAQGNSGVASADEVIVVNNLTEGGTSVIEGGVTKVKVLSAEMGKQLAEQTLAGVGEFADAFERAFLTMVSFPWVLKDVDDDNNRVTKMIWHAGDLKFIDAVGAEVDWYKKGITIITETPCIFRVTDDGTANNAIDIPLARGANNIQFSQLHPQGSTVAENVIKKGWFLKTTASAGISPSNSDKTTDILYADFGGLIVKENLSLHGEESIKLKTIKNLVLNGTITNWNGWLNYAPYVEHIDISGTLTYASYGNKLLQFNLPKAGTPNNLTRLDLSNLNAPMYNVQYMPNLSYLDIRGMNPKKDENNYTESQYNLPMTQFVKNLSTLVIGDFDTSTYSLPSGKTLFGALVSTDTTSGLTLVCTKSTPPANTGNAETDVIVELLTKATAILVPPNSISAYLADAVWGSANFVSKISEYNEGDY